MLGSILLMTFSHTLSMYTRRSYTSSRCPCSDLMILQANYAPGPRTSYRAS